MKSNKDENEPLKIEIEAKMKKIKAICCITFNISFVSRYKVVPKFRKKIFIL